MTTLFQICPASFSRVDSSSIVKDSMNLTADFLRFPSLDRKVIISINRTCMVISWRYVYASKKSLLTYFACCCSMASMRGVGITNQRTAFSEKIQNCDQLSIYRAHARRQIHWAPLCRSASPSAGGGVGPWRCAGRKPPLCLTNLGMAGRLTIWK